MQNTGDSEHLFLSVKQPLLRQLAQRGVLRNYKRGAVLMDEGDRGDTMLVVLSGRLKAYSELGNTRLANGNAAGASGQGREITYGVYGPGSLVGEMAMDGGPRSASVMTLEPSMCSVISRDTVLNFIGEQPEFAFELLGRVIARARQATHSMRSLVMTDAYGRLCELLTSLSVSNGRDGVVVSERLTHRDIGNRIGCSREMVSRLLKDLETGGYLELSAERRYIIHKPLPARW